MIGTIDDDTIINLDWVKQAKKIFEENGEKLVAIGGPVIYSNSGFFLKRCLDLYFLFSWLNPRSFTFWGCNGVFRKSSYEKIGGLHGYDRLRKDLNLKYSYDDNLI